MSCVQSYFCRENYPSFSLILYSMTIDSLLELCRRQLATKHYVDLPDDVFHDLTLEQAKAIAHHFHGKAFLMLPAKERMFFEWVRTHDLPVWNDLWYSDDITNEPYIVSISLLPSLLDDVRGFPICDLQTVDNYYFTDDHFISDEADVLLEGVKERYLAQQTVTVSQLLALEINNAPIDIWRFAYHHRVDLQDAKSAVHRLADEKLLLHLKSADDLADFVELEE